MVESDTSTLAAWLHYPATRKRRQRTPPPVTGSLRFAFYGRVSTTDRQEPAVSRRWQHEVATDTIGDAGHIVRDFFDIGCSRSIPWPDRAQARALLEAVADPDRDFDAIIIGGADRAFSGGQLQQILPILNRHRVALWLPELDGPLDAGNPVHQALILILGHDARREVQRARHRTLTAMRVLARDEGRFLGGRPPYGYQLVDAGPHPNRKHAQWGRRLKRLNPAPATAGHVTWIFTQRLRGLSAHQIAVLLTERGIPSPAASDPDRNTHRAGPAWSRRAVDTILANPRYTGRQVFGRQRITHHESSPGGRHAGGPPTRGPNDRNDVVISSGLAHPALISEATFVAAQKVSAVAGPRGGGERRYLLTGLVICGSCGRRAEGAWVSGRAAYRCRHAQRGRRAADSVLPFYAREDTLLNMAAAALDNLTGGGQTLWETAAVSDYLRARDLTLSSTRTGVTLLGTPPGKAAVTIPGMYGVNQINTLGTTAKARTTAASPRKTVTPTTAKRKIRRITTESIKKDRR